jgi:cytochrome c-type biogenesis protein CcmH/NrfG
VLWLLVLGLHADAAPRWTQLQSENFLYIGDASEREIRHVAERLEKFRDALLRALPRVSPKSPTPTVVMVFDNDRSMTPAKPLFRGKPIELAGYFDGGEDVNYIAVNAETLVYSMEPIFHEYAHFLINESHAEVPLWVNEGMAELYSNAEQRIGGKSVVIGRAQRDHLALLQSSTMLPIKDLVAVDHSAAIYNEGHRRRGVLYAQSWALVHYLTLGNAARAAQFRDYLLALQSGRPHAESFDAAFGDAATLYRELYEYVRRDAFTAVEFDVHQKSAAMSVPRGTKFDDDEADAYLADMQARVGRVDDARTRVAAIQKRAPKVGRAYMVLGGIDLSEKRVSDAVAHLRKAAALAPDDFIVQSTYGRGLVAQMSEARNDADRAATILPEARAALTRATRLDPRSARAAWMLGYVELVGGGDVPVAVQALTRAVELDPRREEYRMLLARALAQQGEYDKATTLLGPLMASGRTPDVKTEARRVLTDVVNRREQQKRAATPAVAVPAGAPAPAAPATAAPSPVDAVATTKKLVEAERARGLLLRVVQPGELRVLGTLDAIDCATGLFVLRVTSNGRTLALSAKQLADVDLISYRSRTPDPANCGPQKSRYRVYATYRPEGSGAGLDGVAVAIELLPDDFVPQP